MPRVIMYPHENYGGEPYSATVSCATLPAGVNDEVSSVKIDAGTAATFYRNANYGGYFLVGFAGPNEFPSIGAVWPHGIEGSWNDSIGSVIIRTLASHLAPAWDALARAAAADMKDDQTIVASVATALQVLRDKSSDSDEGLLLTRLHLAHVWRTCELEKRQQEILKQAKPLEADFATLWERTISG